MPALLRNCYLWTVPEIQEYHPVRGQLLGLWTQLWTLTLAPTLIGSPGWLLGLCQTVKDHILHITSTSNVLTQHAMKCFVAFWERLTENQRRRVAIRPALQPTGARITAFERPTQMRKKERDSKEILLFSNPTGTRTGSWFSPFLDSFLGEKLPVILCLALKVHLTLSSPSLMF